MREKFHAQPVLLASVPATAPRTAQRFQGTNDGVNRFCRTKSRLACRTTLHFAWATPCPGACKPRHKPSFSKTCLQPTRKRTSVRQQAATVPILCPHHTPGPFSSAVKAG